MMTWSTIFRVASPTDRTPVSAEAHPGGWLASLVADAVTDGSAAARGTAVAAVSPELVERLLHGEFENRSADLEVVATGTGASPGAAAGVVCLSSEEVMDAVDRDEPAILVCTETSPSDEPGMRLAEGIVTTRGGMTSHTAVVARGWGLPAVV